MKNLKSILALLLALVMVLSLAACGGNSAEDTKAPAADDTKAPAADDDTTAAAGDDTTAAGLDWLNLGGVTPIVDEGVEKTLSMVLPLGDEFVDNYKNTWQYIWTTEVLNINLEVTPVPRSAWSEKRPLILADTENLPDIIFNSDFSTGDLLRYGAEEGLLVDIAPYINEQYMPCLTSLFADHPEYKTPWTDADGHVWGVGFINHITRPDERQWHYLNYQWIQDCGMDPATDLPETLDEFTDLMRKFKEVKSAEFGEEIYPISGKYHGWNSIYRYLLNALGYVGSNMDDSFPGGQFNLRNGEPVLPCADREGWEGFVKTMKLWYDEGLVHPEYFTGDSKSIEALITQGKTGFCTVPLFVWIGNEACKDWWGAPALTSDWCDQPGYVSNAAANGAPTWHITTACEEVELAVAFFDFFFKPQGSDHRTNASLLSHGLCPNDPLAEKYPQFIAQKEDAEGNHSFADFDTDVYVDSNDFMAKNIHIWGWGIWGLKDLDAGSAGQMDVSTLDGYPEAQEAILNYQGKCVDIWYDYPAEVRTGNGVFFQYVPAWTNYNPLRIPATEELPTVIYFDAETTETANDLFVTINEFVNTETAKFIVGDRPIEELPDYFDELDALGVQDYIKIYTDYYASVMG